MAQGFDSHRRGDFVLAVFVAEHFAAAVPLASPVRFRAGVGTGSRHFPGFFQVMAQGIRLQIFQGDHVFRRLLGVPPLAHPALVMLRDALLGAGGGRGFHLLDVVARELIDHGVGIGHIPIKFAVFLIHA